MKRRHFVGALSASIAQGAVFQAQAETWPSKPVTWVYAYAAGGGGDPVARILAEGLSTRLGQAVIVENRTGAAGMVGTGFVARAAPDGYTFLFGVSGEIVINQWLYKKMPYEPAKDLQPVCLLMTLPLLLVASTSSGIKTVGDLVAKAKVADGRINFASPGIGSLQHLSAELLQHTLGISMTHVPYRGVAAAVNDLIAGTVDVGFVGLPTALPYVRAGRLNAIGLSTSKKAPSARDLPTLASNPALKTFDVTQWFGLMAPSGTPVSVTDRVRSELAVVMNETRVKALMYSQGFEPSLSSNKNFSSFILSERERYGRVIHDAGIRVEGS